MGCWLLKLNDEELPEMAGWLGLEITPGGEPMPLYKLNPKPSSVNPLTLYLKLWNLYSIPQRPLPIFKTLIGKLKWRASERPKNFAEKRKHCFLIGKSKRQIGFLKPEKLLFFPNSSFVNSNKPYITQILNPQA
jgi:hypothetical protein